MSKRKSGIGSRALSKEPPPVAPGRPWWTEPPTAIVLDEHIVYATEYRLALIDKKEGKRNRKLDRINSLIAKVNEWIRVANIKSTEHKEKQARDAASRVGSTEVINTLRTLCLSLLSEIGRDATPTEQKTLMIARKKATGHARPPVVSVRRKAL